MYNLTKVKALVEKDALTQIDNRLDITFPKGLLGAGESRTAYKVFDDAHTPIVLKVDNFIGFHNKYGNKAEWEVFCNISEHKKELLPYILTPLACWQIGNHCILAFPFVEVIESENVELFETYMMNNSFNQCYKNMVNIFNDTNDENIGMVNGLPILIDYNLGTRFPI
jgi:hypothetical protein